MACSLDGRTVRNVAAVLALPLTALLLSACSDEAGSSSPEAASTVPPSLGSSEVVQGLSGADERTLWEAQRVLIEECMAAAGLDDYRMNSWEENQENNRLGEAAADQLNQRERAVADPSWARENGYGLRTDVELPRMQNQEGGEQITLALYGETTEEVTLPDGTPLQYGTDGCYGKAEQKIYEDQGAWSRVQYYVINLPATANRLVREDARVVEANASWSECMAGVGWPGFVKPGDAFTRAHAAVNGDVPGGRDIEKQIAFADATCHAQADYLAIEENVRSQVIEGMRSTPDPDVDVFIEMRQAALVRAGEILTVQ